MITLVVTGVLITWRQVGSLAALVGTRYGQLLAVKLAVVGSCWLGGALDRRAAPVRRAGHGRGPAGTGQPLPAARGPQAEPRTGRPDDSCTGRSGWRW